MTSQVQEGGTRYESLKEQFHGALMGAFTTTDEQVINEPFAQLSDVTNSACHTCSYALQEFKRCFPGFDARQVAAFFECYRQVRGLALPQPPQQLPSLPSQCIPMCRCAGPVPGQEQLRGAVVSSTRRFLNQHCWRTGLSRNVSFAVQAEFEVIYEEAQLASKFAAIDQLCEEQGLSDAPAVGCGRVLRGLHASRLSFHFTGACRTSSLSCRTTQRATRPADIMQTQRVLAKQREVQELTSVLAEVRSERQPSLCWHAAASCSP